MRLTFARSVGAEVVQWLATEPTEMLEKQSVLGAFVCLCAFSFPLEYLERCYSGFF